MPTSCFDWHLKNISAQNFQICFAFLEDLKLLQVQTYYIKINTHYRYIFLTQLMYLYFFDL